MKFSIKDFFCKCDQIRIFLRIWSHLLNKSFLQNFIFCAVYLAKHRLKLQRETKGMFRRIRYNHYNFQCFIATHVLDFNDCTQLNTFVTLFCLSKILLVYSSIKYITLHRLYYLFNKFTKTSPLMLLQNSF